ncbi:MAG TPA: galactose-1-phosphate uridylyltransferase [Pseudomonadales bacterium]|nr:galactose-1-phosphate uridylyltransferase [Pseudomonadales bacterium]
MTWERRWHPLREEWVTITSHRNTRPWSGASASQTVSDTPRYIEDCYLCPGNSRVSNATNPDYESVFVFDNDHPAFSMDAPGSLETPAAPYRNAPARGICRVVCYAPRHDLTLAQMAPASVADVIDCWAEQTRDLYARTDIEHVLIFENKGDIVGVSNPHPHCQIYAADFTFKGIDVELAAMQRYRREHQASLFDAVIEAERHDGRRIIAENRHAIAFVPYFARFPYEVYIAPLAAHNTLAEMDRGETGEFAQVLHEALVRLDNLWQTSFPYMLVVHQSPVTHRAPGSYHCHIQIHPPLRRPGLQKFLAGVETGGGHFLNDKSPEEAAADLQAVEPVHYRSEQG